MPSKRLSVEKIITYDRAIMVHKILRKRCPENLKGKFTRRNQISKYETRRMRDLQIPKHGENSQREVFRTSKLRSGTISQMPPEMWNLLISSSTK